MLLTCCLVMVFSFPAFGGIARSKHDFSPLGTSNFSGNFRLPSGAIITEVCVFCHTPHSSSTDNAYKNNNGTGSNIALWNRIVPVGAGTANSSSRYTLYSSPSLTRVNMQTPTGQSLMCLSCHDGVTSIAVGDASVGSNVLLNGPGSGNQPITLTTPGLYDKVGDIYWNDPLVGGWGANIGNLLPGFNPLSDKIDLSNDHPVSFSWPLGVIPGIKTTAPTNPSLRLFGSLRMMECSTCHNVHDNTTYPPFLVMSNGGSAMCLACHDK